MDLPPVSHKSSLTKGNLKVYIDLPASFVSDLGATVLESNGLPSDGEYDDQLAMGKCRPWLGVQTSITNLSILKGQRSLRGSEPRKANLEHKG